MRATALLSIVLMALATSAASEPPGHHSFTFEYVTMSHFDFKDGVGIYDGGDPYATYTYTPCMLWLLGYRGTAVSGYFGASGAGSGFLDPLGPIYSVIHPYVWWIGPHPRPIIPYGYSYSFSDSWESDQGMATNLNGPGIGISDLGIGGKYSGGLDTGIPCPTDIGGTGANIFIAFHGMNWRSARADSLATLNLCTQKVFPSNSFGCYPFPTQNMKLWVSACGDQAGADSVGNVASRTHFNPYGTGNQPDWTTANFGGDYTDTKGKYFAGEPWDTLNMKSDVIKCPVRKTVDYTDTIQGFSSGRASQTWDLIKNELVVSAGSGTTYIAICWQIEYADLGDPLNVVWGLAQAHDWKLIIDLNDPDNAQALVPDAPSWPLIPIPDGPSILGGGLLDVLEAHYTGHRFGDFSTGAPAFALRGFYSDDTGDSKDGGFAQPASDGQNGFGPCLTPDQYWGGYGDWSKKPSPLI